MTKENAWDVVSYQFADGDFDVYIDPVPAWPSLVDLTIKNMVSGEALFPRIVFHLRNGQIIRVRAK